ncbi:MAG: 3-isopropylmalate dehydratase large subunit [Saprospiraceae bacterium]|nr:3-isopropylmalate dehydratase large subunit [Saprospiraceae bacterium]
MKKTLFDKLWDMHVVKTFDNGPSVFYIDRHYIHEVTSPQAFKGLEDKGLEVFRPNQIIATADHNVPTLNQELPIKDPLSATQVSMLTDNCNKHGIKYYPLGSEYQGIVHVIGPELGFTLPGMTIVCGDSHTSTHGAFGCIAFGIGTSQVEQVLASQCLLLSKPKRMRIKVDGKLKQGVLSKDVILHIIAKLGTGGATGYFVEYAGTTFEAMSMEERMTVCNMSIEMGARGGLIAPDQTTFDYIASTLYGPKGAELEDKVKHWSSLKTDSDAVFDKEIHIEAATIEPMITYGTNPGMGINIFDQIPSDSQDNELAKSLNYMGLKPGESLLGKSVDYVFIGSCTNSRIEDLRIAAEYVKGKQKAADVTCWIVPGSKLVEKQAIAEGLDKIFQEAGIKMRQPGCSACLAMNDDKIPEGKLCISTSNRNFEGRQGQGARTILASPLTAIAAAVHGKIWTADAAIERNQSKIESQSR